MKILLVLWRKFFFAVIKWGELKNLALRKKIFEEHGKLVSNGFILKNLSFPFFIPPTTLLCRYQTILKQAKNRMELIKGLKLR